MEQIKTIQLDARQLRKLQMEMFSILCEFDRICRKHDIKYFLSGGTLLGAVRHQGFIPWDDDVDVELPREEYERFCAVCGRELDHKRFFLQTQKTDPFYLWTYGKLRLKGTRYVRSGQEHLKQRDGICIDIFPLDTAAKDAFSRKASELICKFCRKSLWAKVGFLRESVIWKRWLYRLLQHIPRNWIGCLFEKTATAHKGEETPFMVFHHMDSRSPRGYEQDRSWYRSYIDVEFESRKFLAPIGCHELLYFWYGNYMEYPPSQKQVGNAWASYIRFSDQTELKGEKLDE